MLEHTAHTLLLPVEAIGGGSQFCQAVVGRNNQRCRRVFLSHAPRRKGIVLVKGVQEPIKHRFIIFGLYHLSRQNAQMFGFLLVTQGGVSTVL